MFSKKLVKTLFLIFSLTTQAKKYLFGDPIPLKMPIFLACLLLRIFSLIWSNHFALLEKPRAWHWGIIRLIIQKNALLMYLTDYLFNMMHLVHILKYMYIWIWYLFTNIYMGVCTEAEFFDVIGTKVLRVFLLAIHCHLYYWLLLPLRQKPRKKLNVHEFGLSTHSTRM